jgi:hypothetical protein
MQKTPHPAAPGGAHRVGSSKGLGGTFDPQDIEPNRERQHHQESVPIAQIGIDTQPVGLKYRRGVDRVDAIKREAMMRAVATDGMRALECTKRAAAFHEAGHCLIAIFDGTPPVRASIWPIQQYGQTQWIGRTYGTPKLRVTDKTPAEADLRQARSQLAGVAAEAVFDADYRLASSLDEIVISQGIVRTAALKTLRDPETLWLQTFFEVVKQLKAHDWLVREIAGELLHKGTIKGRRLTRLLQSSKGTASDGTFIFDGSDK